MEANDTTPAEATTRHPVARRASRLLIRGLILAAVVALIVALNGYATAHPALATQLQALGYPGLFAAAAISGFNVLVPIPVAGFTPALIGAGYSPLWVIVIFSLGMSVGDLAGYVVGMLGRHANGRRVPAFVDRLRVWSAERPVIFMLSIFAYAALVPMPNEVFVIPLAFARVAWHRLLVPIAAGHVVLNTLIFMGFDFLGS